MKKAKIFLLIISVALFLFSCTCGEEIVKKKVVMKKPVVKKKVVKVEKKPAMPKPAPLPKIVPPKDTDNDGIIDKFDKCPGTPKGAPVDYQGCWNIGMIHFDYDKYNIKPEYYSTLNTIACVLKQNPDIKVQVSCHTDSRGSKKYNINLSKKRCESVKNYLINKGVFPGKIILLYFGKNKPALPNTNSKNMAYNRRAEFKIVK